MNRSVIILGTTFVLAAAGAGVYFSIRSNYHSAGFPEFLAPSLRQAHISREKDWKRTNWIAASLSPADIARQWEGLMRDPEALLSDDQKDSLLTIVSRFAHAYSTETADEYVRLVESLPWLVWRPEPEKIYPHLEYYSQKVYSPEGAPTARELLVEAWPDIMTNDSRPWQNGWVKVGADQGGALFIADKIYSASPGNGLSVSSEDEWDKWAGAPLHAYFHNFTWTAPEFAPAEGSREALPALVEEHVSAVVVYAHVMVETRQRRPFVWSSRWVWSPVHEYWICDEMVIGTGRVVSGIF